MSRLTRPHPGNERDQQRYQSTALHARRCQQRLIEGLAGRPERQVGSGSDVTVSVGVCSNSANEPDDENDNYDGSNYSVSEHSEFPFNPMYSLA